MLRRMNAYERVCATKKPYGVVPSIYNPAQEHNVCEKWYKPRLWEED